VEHEFRAVIQAERQAFAVAVDGRNMAMDGIGGNLRPAMPYDVGAIDLNCLDDATRQLGGEMACNRLNFRQFRHICFETPNCPKVKTPKRGVLFRGNALDDAGIVGLTALTMSHAHDITWQAWFTLGLLVVMLYGLIRRAHLTDIIFLGGLTLLALLGIITPTEALAGFSNPAMLTVAALFVVAAGLRESGALDNLARRMLGHPQGERRTLTRLLVPIAGMSAFLNNTTIVAMGMPVVVDWCRKHRQSASRYLMPLSHATVAGGLCTLIGTSTNLVVHGLMLDSPETRHVGMGFFEIGYVGLPITVVVLLYLIFIAPRLLPHRQELLERLGESRREYMIEMLVEPTCPFVGHSVQAAGLRQLPGLYLVEIERDGQVLSPVGPDELLESGDHLVFVGVVSTIVDLQKTKGLVAVEEQGRTSLVDRLGRRLCETVISSGVRSWGEASGGQFSPVYDAAVIAVHRSGERLTGKIGDIVLRPGTRSCSRQRPVSCGPTATIRTSIWSASWTKRRPSAMKSRIYRWPFSA
jgi:hypothetical protein